MPRICIFPSSLIRPLRPTLRIQVLFLMVITALGINYRNQWSSMMTIPYKTMSAFGDVQVSERIV